MALGNERLRGDMSERHESVRRLEEFLSCLTWSYLWWTKESSTVVDRGEAGFRHHHR